MLIQKEAQLEDKTIRTCLNGYLVQDRDNVTDAEEHLSTATETAPTSEEIEDLLFASKICKHTKSNTIVLVKNGQLLASGTGQTSQVDALRQAIEKATNFGFDLNGAVMASDAFFPSQIVLKLHTTLGYVLSYNPEGRSKINCLLIIATLKRCLWYSQESVTLNINFS